MWRIQQFNEILGFYGLPYWYTWQVTILGLGPIWMSNNKEAIVFAETSTVKNAPTFNSEEVFILHEGTKVQLLEVFNDWTKIRLSDGMIGWLESQAVEEI